MLINKISGQHFGYYDIGNKAKATIANASQERQKAIEDAKEKVKYLRYAGVSWRGENAVPCVISQDIYEFCPPYVPETPIDNWFRVNAVWDNENAGPSVGTKINCVLAFPDKPSAMQAYKEINEGSVLDSACAFAKYLDQNLSEYPTSHDIIGKSTYASKTAVM